jgi:Icc-related predicted phosphoesterase
MKIAGITDIHGDKAALSKARPAIAAADVILLVGDITNFYRNAFHESSCCPRGNPYGRPPPGI